MKIVWSSRPRPDFWIYFLLFRKFGWTGHQRIVSVIASIVSAIHVYLFRTLNHLTVFDCKLNLCCPFLLQIPATLPFSIWVRSVINDVTKGCGSTWHPVIFSLWREITYYPTNPNSSDRLPEWNRYFHSTYIKTLFKFWISVTIDVNLDLLFCRSCLRLSTHQLCM